MKHKFKTLLSIAFSMVFLLSFSVTAFAAPKQMADGQFFDSEYYAQANPDVVKVLGTDENALYKHYLEFGKKEGRLPYLPAAQTSTLPVTKNLPINNLDAPLERVITIAQAYDDLPQNVKNFCNTKRLRIYATSSEYVQTQKNNPKVGGFCTAYVTTNISERYADIYVAETKWSDSREILYHELGHAIDCFLGKGMNRYSDSWEGWYEMALYDPKYCTDKGEAFALAVEGYYYDNAKLKKKAPMAYMYIENVLANLK